MPEDLKDVDFAQLKKVANGMMPEETYQAIYKAAAGVRNGQIVEVGTAHGAATIAMALGLQVSGYAGRVITMDKISGGSRDQFGDTDTNLEIIAKNFRTFGVENLVEFHLGASEDIATTLPDDLKIGMLMLDADGAIDRDFALFYNAVLPGAPIVIDDYKEDYVRISRHGNRVNIEQKRRITSALVQYFESKKLLQRDSIIGETWLGHKPETVTAPVEFNLSEIMKFYRQLVFAEGDLHSTVAEIVGRATRPFPGLHKALKNIYMPKKD